MYRLLMCSALLAWMGTAAVVGYAQAPATPADEAEDQAAAPVETSDASPGETDAAPPVPADAATPDETPAETDDENPGLGELDRAAQLKVSAEGLGDLNEVIDLLESALEKGLDEDNAEFANHLLMSTLLQRASTFASAILDRQLADPRQDPRWLQIRQFALTDLQRVVEMDERLWDAHLLIGRLQTLPLGDPRAARSEFTKVINSADAEPKQRAAALAMRGTVQQDEEKQLADFNEAIVLVKDKPEYLRLRAQHYYTQEQFDDALADIDNALRLEPEHATSHELRGMILLGLERYDDALLSFDRATELAPEAALPYQHRAELYRLQGNLEKAAEQLTKALELAPGNTATLLLRASIYFQLQKPELAIADVENIIRRQPQLLQAHLMRAELYAATDRVDQAIEQLERLSQFAPGQAQILEQLGSFYLVDGRPQKAIEACSEIIEADADNARALRTRGDAYLNIGRHAEAVADFDRALEVSAEDLGVLNNLAWVLATSPVDEVRDGQRAVQLATKAGELSAYQMPHILSTLAAAYAETGDFDSAMKWSEKAVELGKDDPSYEQLTQELAGYREGKPWREMQQAEDKPKSPSPSDHTYAPSAVPAPARTADF